MKIPDKENFTLDEVSTISGVRPYIINFWLKEFDMFDKTLAEGKISFKGSDIENILSLKNIMFKEKLSIESAKKKLNSSVGEVCEHEEVENSELELQKVKQADLDFVKEKLSSILQFTESLQKSHNWF